MRSLVRPGAAGLVLAAVAAIGLAGCSSATDSGAPAATPTVTATPTATLPECASIYAGANAGRLPAGTALDSVTVCGATADGSTAVVTASHGDQPKVLDRLAMLLAQPDAVMDPDVVCTMEIRVAPDLTVRTADGSVLAPHVPTDVCGKPLLPVVQLLGDLLNGSPTASS